MRNLPPMSGSTGPRQAALGDEAWARLAGRILAEPAPGRHAAASPPEAQARGFTLIELLAAVVIVMTIAAASIPLATRLVHRSEDAEDARRAASAISSARARAMGRGSSVVVTFGNGLLLTEEVILGPDGTCAGLPQLGCERVGLWDSNGRRRQVESMRLGSFDGAVTAAPSGGANVLTFRVCFNPGGQMYVDPDGTGVFSRANGATVISFAPRAADLRREVVVLPNGSTRVIARQEPPQP